MAITLDEDEAQVEKDCVRASYYFIEDAMCELEDQGSENWPPHCRKLYSWMKTVIDQGRQGALFPGSQLWHKATEGMKQMLIDELSETNGACKLLVQVGTNLAAIVRGDITPLELMMEGNLLGRFYTDLGAVKRSYRHIIETMELFALKRPGAKVLEIGAGTGGATQGVLDAFNARAKQDGLTGSLLGHYVFTDISSGFFEAARQRFAAWEGMIDFQVLDIEADPASQSAREGHYDLVVAAMVLHATKSLKTTLSNARKMLKPGGKLLLLEITQDQVYMQLIFGTLPGWWLGEEDGRKMSPNVSAEVWDKVLRETGFSGVDFEIRDCEDKEFYEFSTILSTAVTTHGVRGPISIVHSETKTPPSEWLSHLCDQIQAQTGVLPSIESLDQVRDQAHDKLCIFIAEMEDPIVSEMDENSFLKLRNLLTSSRDVLWLSCGGLLDDEEPLFAATQGLLRALRVEDTSKRYIHLDFSRTSSPKSNTWTADKIGLIIHVLQQSFNEQTDMETIEREYAAKDSILHVSRAYPAREEDRLCSSTPADPASELQPFCESAKPLVWELSGSGLLNDLHFVEAEVDSYDLADGRIEVETKALGINFRDVMDALGLLDAALVGHETAGIITRLGPGTEESGLQVGDRVCGLTQGLFANVEHMHWQSVTKIPDSMSFADAAAIPTIFVTAYHSLFPVARLKRNESVLIHAATGGVGQAAIILAQRAGAEIFANCSTAAKRDLLIEQYHIKPDHILSSRDASFAAAIMEKTNGKGVHVVLNSLSGPLLKASWDCVARFGRFIEIGKVDMAAGRHLDMIPFQRCAMYASVDVLQLLEYDLPALQEALVECVRICHERRVSPVYPITTYSISEMEKAMRSMQSGTHVGKLVLLSGEGDLVKVIPRLKPLSLMNEDATYLIIGGLTGLGREITDWMISRGARNLALISRRATSHPAAKELRAMGEKAGCNVHIRNCDITDESSLINFINDCHNSMPPIRGFIDGAMVLDDSILEAMTFEQWYRATQPKIKGSQNLYKHLPGLQFSVLLSSITGVAGHPSQTNYGAGGAYLDSLARNRTRNGQPAVALDLSAVLSAGYVADREKSGDQSVHNRVKRRGFVFMDIDQVLKLVEDAIRNPLRKSPYDSQVATGVTEKTTARWAQDGLPQDPRFGTLQLARPRGSGILAADGAAAGASVAKISAILVSSLSAAATPAEATRLLEDALVAKIAGMFNIPASDIDTGLPMSRYGVDSLVAVELRKWLTNVVRAKVSVFDILQSASVVDFAALLATRSELVIVKTLTST